MYDINLHILRSLVYNISIANTVGTAAEQCKQYRDISIYYN